MVNKEILNQEFLKSIESEYIFDNAPINRLKKNEENDGIDKKLIDLKEKIKSIEDCELKKFAKNLVFSDGNPNSKIMIVGEGPGEKEDIQGKPFVGEAGMLLNRMLNAIKIKREDIYITNVVNYRPPKNRKPENILIGLGIDTTRKFFRNNKYLEPIKESILNQFAKSEFFKKVTKHVANLGLNQ
mgnify:CR=1 FL=1